MFSFLVVVNLLVVNLAVLFTNAQDVSICATRVSLCTMVEQCPIDNAQFFMPQIGFLDMEEFAPGTYTVLYPCVHASAQIFILAAGCKTFRDAILLNEASQSKIHIDCTRTCGDLQNATTVSVTFISSCGADLAGLGVDFGNDISSLAYLNNASITLTTTQLPVDVTVYHPTHTTRPLQLTGISTAAVLQCKVDGEWGMWNIGQCSRSCGTGVRTRTRLCNQPFPANGRLCIGDPEIPELCNPNPCPVDGGWGTPYYTTCTTSCGGGTRDLVRMCNNPLQANNGQDCMGEAILVNDEPCNTQPCPIDGGPGVWTHWGPCSCRAPSDVAPARLRTRPCDSPAPQFGGSPCEPGTLIEYDSNSCSPAITGTCLFCDSGCCSGSSYQFIGELDHVYYHRLNCQALGGKLVEINCPHEKSIVDQLIAAEAILTDQVWLGMVRILNQIVFMSSDDPVLYLEWHPNEPDFNDDCFELLQPTWLWRDAVCNSHQEQAICEFNLP